MEDLALMNTNNEKNLIVHICPIGNRNSLSSGSKLNIILLYSTSVFDTVHLCSLCGVVTVMTILLVVVFVIICLYFLYSYMLIFLFVKIARLQCISMFPVLSCCKG